MTPPSKNVVPKNLTLQTPLITDSLFQKELSLAGAMRLSHWRKIIGVSRATAFRWRKAGKLKVVRRYGIAFVTAGEILRFWSDNPPSA
jgi:hypothetical protein